MVAEVLLIDDEKSFGVSLKNVLSNQYGISVDYASTWDEGIGLFRVGQHELVIADYNLPGSRNGLKLLANIKRLRPSTRLVLISGFLPKDAEKTLSPLGLVDRYVAKSPTEMIAPLVEEAQAAVERAKTPSDWPNVTGAHVASESIDPGEIDRIDKVLSGYVPGTRS